MSAMDESHLLAEVSRVLESDGDRREKAASVAKVVRTLLCCLARLIVLQHPI
jgi:hypothetical protein